MPGEVNKEVCVNQVRTLSSVYALYGKVFLPDEVKRWHKITRKDS